MKESKPEGLRGFLKVKDFINEKLNHYKSELAEIEGKIENIINEPLSKVRLLQGKDTRTITAMVENVEVKQDVPKKVAWNQDKLKEIRLKIASADDDPDKYMSAKFSVSEKEYKMFPPAIKTVFMVAREIKPGKARLTFKTKEV